MASRVEPGQCADSPRLSAEGAENLMGGAPRAILRLAVEMLVGGRPRESLKGAEVCERIPVRLTVVRTGGGAGRKTPRVGLFARANTEGGPVNQITGTARAGIL